MKRLLMASVLVAGITGGLGALSARAQDSKAMDHDKMGMQKDGMSKGAMMMKADKDGMVSKQEYMRMMEAKFDEMDHGKKGMLSRQDVNRIMVFLSGRGTEP